MGRGHRGGGAAGKAGRGGRRAGGGGGARGHGGGRPGQPTATIPTGEALLVELRASPAFHDALKGRDCPARSHEASSGATPLGTSQLELADWRDLGALIGWFRDGIAADPLAELAFSTRLTKAARASVHGTATAVGLGGLGTSSKGLGEERRVVVMARERAERALPQLDEKQDKKAFWVWRWALQRGLQVSRDEVGEMVLKDSLTPELQSIWDKGASQQRAVQQLCAAVAAGDAAGVEAALAASPGLLEECVFDVESGVAPLHVAAREGQTALLELLLSRGADPNGQDGHGWTALQVSRKVEQSDAEGALLRAGAHDPDKDRSILERPARLPRDTPPPAAPGANGAAASQAELSSAAAPPPQSDLDSNASVCGTERDNPAGDVSSNADDYADPQYQSGPAAFDPVEEEQAGAAEEEEPVAAADDSAGAELHAGSSAVQDSGSEAAAAPSAQSAVGQAEGEQAEPQPAAEAAVAKAKPEAERADEEEETEEEDSDEEAGEAASYAAETAAEEAMSAFAAAVAAAEAAEAAAEEAESLGGSEGAARAAAFRREGEAAVAAAAAAAVAAGEQLDGLIETMRSGGSMALPSPPVELDSNASVCGSDLQHIRSLEAFGSELAASGPSGSMSVTGSTTAAAAAAAEPPTPAPSAADTGNSGAEERREDAARAAVGDAAQALAGTGTAAAAAGEAAAGGAPAEGHPAREAVPAAAGDVRSVVAAAAGEGAAVAKEAASELSSAAATMRAELEARLPEWSAWAQEHPGTLLAGAGVATAALAGLLLLYRRR